MTARTSVSVAESGIRDGRLIAIVRVPRLDDSLAAELTSTLVDAGVRALEFTLDSVGALPAISVARDVAGSRATIGAGTVLDAAQVERAAAAGAQFVVSPDVSPAVIARTLELGLLSLPGALTATEVRLAVTSGAHMVKLFPAMPGGVGYLRALRGPLSDVAFVPTGGVRVEDVPGFLDAGAVAVALGSALVSSMSTTGLADRAAAAVAAVAQPISRA